MCQMSVVLQKAEKTEKIIEEVVKVEIKNNGIMVSTFFDDPKFIDNVMIKEIDCLGSTVTLLDREEIIT
jgi:predicted RNA-binding protein